MLLSLGFYMILRSGGRIHNIITVHTPSARCLMVRQFRAQPWQCLLALVQKDVLRPAHCKSLTVKDGGGITKTNILSNSYGCKKVSCKTQIIWNTP